MLCALLDWQYAELPSSASDCVLYSFVRCGSSKQIERKKKEKKKEQLLWRHSPLVFFTSSGQAFINFNDGVGSTDKNGVLNSPDAYFT